eukprot:Tbor_TRINITY_DN5773_c3_g1::TRINITY_DN5773_c3_g1_i1::g.20524::m.20524
MSHTCTDVTCGVSGTSTAEQALLQVAEQIERAIDDELDATAAITDTELATLRRRRLQQLKTMTARRDKWLSIGHGNYNILTDPKDFFKWIQSSERLICHFGRPATHRSAILDKHFGILSQKHVETRFIYIDVERYPALASTYNVVMLPHVMLIEGQKTFHSIIGFDEFGGRDDFSTEKCEEVLVAFGMLNENDMFSADQTSS